MLLAVGVHGGASSKRAGNDGTDLSLSNSLSDLRERLIAGHTLVIGAVRATVEHALAFGDLLLEAKAHPHLKHGQWLPWLESCGISTRMAQRYMQLARKRAEIEAKYDTVTHLGIRGALELLAPTNAGRAIMARRQEPADSLDFFPTPPWATRALIECVFPVLGIRQSDLAKVTVWEPACGEGHMAEPLSEYFGRVIATDIHDYGYGEAPVDFLSEDTRRDADWGITNPPFGDKTVPFVLRLLKLARVGVAVFVRLQWLENPRRYELLFRDHPPTLVAIFAERVPLHEGRWEPDGDTLTAYCWLVWIHGVAPRPPFWIPPNCREQLTRPDDAVRFTTHPVTRKSVAPPVESVEQRDDLDIPKFLRRTKTGRGAP
jgi:hypothetical protein